jgi:phosphoesterase RecJ-like protein
VKGEIKKLKGLLFKPSKVILLTHTRPDGDAVASLLALSLGLKSIKHEVFALLPGGVPSRFSYLPGLEFISDQIPNEVDLIIAVDCADENRLGVSPDKLPRSVDINIDHHVSNTDFGHINIVDATAASATQVLFDVLKKIGIPIDVDIAINLLTGLVTDTIGFRTESVTPEVLRLAAELQEIGAPLPNIKHKALYQRTFTALRFWGRGLCRLEQQNGVIWTTLKLADRGASGYSGYDDADLINLLSSVENSRVAVILIEQPSGKVKVSWRAKRGLNVSRLAETFGGGGHEAAAGAMIEGDLEEVTAAVLAATYHLTKLDVETGE